MHKDLRLITETADALGIDADAAVAALGAYGAAVDAGLGADDAVAIVGHTERRQRETSRGSE